MNRRFLLVSLFALLALGMVSCKKTEKEKNSERMLVGVWMPINIKGETLLRSPYFVFNNDNSGNSFLKLKDSKDDFNWEVRKKEVKIYYKKPPLYSVGYDTYNRKASFRLKSITDSSLFVIQRLNSGHQLELRMRKISMKELEIIDDDDSGSAVEIDPENPLG